MAEVLGLDSTFRYSSWPLLAEVGYDDSYDCRSSCRRRF